MNSDLVGPSCLEATRDQTIFTKGLQEADLGQCHLSLAIIDHPLSTVVPVPSDFIGDDPICLF